MVPKPEPKGYSPILPSQLEPNRRWTGIVSKRSAPVDLETGKFYVGIGASHTKRMVLKRIPSRQPKSPTDENLP